jgi:hypothetical protein
LSAGRPSQSQSGVCSTLQPNCHPAGGHTAGPPPQTQVSGSGVSHQPHAGVPNSGPPPNVQMGGPNPDNPPVVQAGGPNICPPAQAHTGVHNTGQQPDGDMGPPALEGTGAGGAKTGNEVAGLSTEQDGNHSGADGDLFEAGGSQLQARDRGEVDMPEAQLPPTLAGELTEEMRVLWEEGYTHALRGNGRKALETCVKIAEEGGPRAVHNVYGYVQNKVLESVHTQLFKAMTKVGAKAYSHSIPALIAQLVCNHTQFWRGLVNQGKLVTNEGTQERAASKPTQPPAEATA